MTVQGEFLGTPTAFATVAVWGSSVDKCVFIFSSSPTSFPSCWKTTHIRVKKIQVSTMFSVLKSGH